jgi:single-strand DNA-binding protein
LLPEIRWRIQSTRRKLFFSLTGMAYELTGKIKKIYDQQDFPSGFYKREFVVTTDERFPQDIKLDCLKEKVEMLNGLGEGSPVKVSFDIRGREWNDRYYVDLSAWKIEAASAGDGNQPVEALHAQPAEDAAQYGIEEDEDIPF